MSQPRTGWLVQFDAAIDDMGTVETVQEISRVRNPGAITTNLFSAGRLSGRSQVGVGEITLDNTDGRLDYLIDFGIDGREVQVFQQDLDSEILGTLPIYTAQLGQPEFSQNVLSLRVRDSLETLNKPLPVDLYAGTNVLPDGLEGTPDDIKGQPKPRCYGTVFNVPAPQVNTSKLIYQVNDGLVDDIPAVYDGAVPFTRGTDYTDTADMLANAPAAGFYRACLTDGYFRLGSSPTRLVTADVVQGAAASDRTVGQILLTIAIEMGASISGGITPPGLTPIDVANTDEVGIWIQDERPAIDIMDEVARSLQAFYVPELDGDLVFGVVRDPFDSTTVLVGYDTTNITDGSLSRVPRQDETGGLPVFRVTVRYAKNYAVQTDGLNAAATQARRAFVAQEYRSVVAEDLDVKLKHLNAQEIVIDTLLIDEADAQAEADRLLALLGRRRDYFQFQTDFLTAYPMRPGSVMQVTHYRYGLAITKKLLCVQQQLDGAANQGLLVGWG